MRKIRGPICDRATATSHVCKPVPAPVSAPWASWATPPGKPVITAAPQGVVSGLFGRSSRDTASEICRLWVPAAGVAVAVTAVEQGLLLQTAHL